MKVVLKPFVILAAADKLFNFEIERLHANFELQRTRWKPGDDFPQCLRQAIRDHLEVKEKSGPMTRQKKLQNRTAEVHIQIEGAIHKLELLHTAIEQLLHFAKKRVQIHRTHRHVER